jgi:putative sugar O-methyltransferase
MSTYGAGAFWSQRLEARIKAMSLPGWQETMRATAVTAEIDDSNGSWVDERWHAQRVRELWPIAKQWLHERGTSQPVEYALNDSLFGKPLLQSMPSCQAVNLSSLEYGMMTASVQTARQLTNAAVVEIGSGYGGLTLRLLRLMPEMYTSIDLEPMLKIQHEYLKATATIAEVCSWRGVDCRDADSVKDALGSASIAINTRSFMEMDIEQVRRYVAAMEDFLPHGAIFYSVNRDKVTKFSDWGMTPERWRTVSATPWPLRPGMVERVFEKR